MGNNLSFTSSREHYAADACIVWCFDNRFWGLFKNFLEVRGFKNFDPVMVAGGAKALAAPEGSSERAYVLDQIQKSVKLHKTPRVILMTHSDCGAYGGLKAFGTEEAERAKHGEELALAATTVTAGVPGVAVEKYFASFAGLDAVA